MNCVLWIFYGLPLIHPHSTLIITINGIGLVLQIFYTGTYFFYTDKKRRVRYTFIYLTKDFIKHLRFITVSQPLFCFVCITVGNPLLHRGWDCFHSIAAIALPLFHTHTSRSNFVGGFCTFFGIVMYAAPLTVMVCNFFPLRTPLIGMLKHKITLLFNACTDCFCGCCYSIKTVYLR